MHIVDYPDITIEKIKEMLGDMRIYIQQSIQVHGKCTVSLYFHHNRWSLNPSDVLIGTTEDGHKYPYIPDTPVVSIEITSITTGINEWADMFMQQLWNREFPVSAKLKSIQAQSAKCGELLEWMEGNGLHFGRYHEHSEECHDRELCGYPANMPKKVYYCGCAEGVLYPTSISITRLLAEFFGIDLRELENEKRRILNETINPKNR